MYELTMNRELEVAFLAFHIHKGTTKIKLHIEGHMIAQIFYSIADYINAKRYSAGLEEFS